MRFPLRAAVAAILILALSSLGLVRAEESSAQNFDIGAQSLASALSEFARQSRQQLLFAPEIVAEKTTKGVKGTLAPRMALSALLEDSGLTFTTTANGAILIGNPRVEVQGHAGVKVAEASSAGAVDSKQAAGSSEETPKLEEVVVTAQKRKELLKDVPISISVLQGDHLDKLTSGGALDSLKSIPGVALLPGNGVGGGTAINVRGVGARSGIDDGSAPIGYYLDGVPVSLIRHAITPDQNSFDLEQIEVLRGPQGTLYGAGSINGLVRVLTKDPDLNRFALKARSTVSQTDESGGINYRGDAAVNVPLVEGKLAARAVIGYDSAGGWIDTPTKEDSNGSRARNYRLKLKAQPSNALSIGLSVWVDRNSKDALDLSDSNARRDNVVLPEPATENFDAYNFKVGYDADHFSLQSSTSYFDYRSIGRIDYTVNPLVSPPLPGLGTDVVTSTVTGKSFSQEIVVNSVSSSMWKWTAGAFYRDLDSALLQVWPGVLSPPLAYEENSRSAAIFGQFGRRFWSERFEWTLGARYFEDKIHHLQDPIAVVPGQAQYQSEGRYHAVTPRAVMTWYPSSAVMAYVSYSQGFRSGVPTAYIVNSSSFPGAKPDKLNSYELGTKLDFLNRRLSFDASVYYLKWNDVQQTVGTTFQGQIVTALTNGASASGSGIDFAVIGRPGEGLELGLNAGWNDLGIDADTFNAAHTRQIFAKGDRVAGSPELTSAVFVNYNHPLSASGYKADLSISASYVSKLYGKIPAAPKFITVSGDDQVIGKASFTLESPLGWSAALFIDNFTNEYGKTYPDLLNYTVDANPRTRPRTVGVQATYNFK